MKMWRCKFCGCKEFEIEKKIINRDFDSKKNILNINDINGIVWCCNCYSFGKCIEDIATWEDKNVER